MDLLLTGRGLPTLPRLTNMSDMESLRERYFEQIDKLRVSAGLRHSLIVHTPRNPSNPTSLSWSFTSRAQTLHTGVYVGFTKPRALPEAFGLRALW